MKVITAPNPILRTKTKPVKKITPELVKVAKEMIKITTGFKDPEGAGLSANQIGRSESFFIAKVGKNFAICINPKVLTSSKKEKVFFEGCFSVPDYYSDIKRPATVKVSYQNENGETVTKTLTGFSSLVFQHELDHLNGILFIDRALQQKSKIYKYKGKDKAERDVYEEIVLI